MALVRDGFPVGRHDVLIVDLGAGTVRVHGRHDNEWVRRHMWGRVLRFVARNVGHSCFARLRHDGPIQPRPGTSASKVTYTKQKFRAHGWKWNVRATRANRAWAGKEVVMQANLCGGWQEMFTKRTNSRGQAAFALNPKAGWNTESSVASPARASRSALPSSATPTPR